MTTDSTNINFTMKTFDDYNDEILINEAPNLEFAQLFPVVPVSEFAKTVGNITVAYTGKAGINSGKLGAAIPVIGFTADPTETQVWNLAFKLLFEDDDILSANSPLSNIDPITTLADAGLDAYSRSLFELGMMGGGIAELKGLANLDTGTAPGQVPTSASTMLWTAGDNGDHILDDLSAGAAAIRMQTGNSKDCTRIVMSDANYTLASTRRVAGTSESALDAFLRGLQQRGRPVPTVHSSIAFTNDVLFYNADPKVLRMLAAQPLRYRNPKEEDNGYTRVGKYRFSGLQIRQGAAMHKLTAVSA